MLRPQHRNSHPSPKNFTRGLRTALPPPSRKANAPTIGRPEYKLAFSNSTWAPLRRGGWRLGGSRFLRILQLNSPSGTPVQALLLRNRGWHKTNCCQCSWLLPANATYWPGGWHVQPIATTDKTRTQHLWMGRGSHYYCYLHCPYHPGFPGSQEPTHLHGLPLLQQAFERVTQGPKNRPTWNYERGCQHIPHQVTTIDTFSPPPLPLKDPSGIPVPSKTSS